MARGIIYIMTTAVPGLIKIGKTGLDNFEQRMYQLERNGYSNVTALKRRFAIEVEDYDDKEKLIDDIFSKSKVHNTELYALDVELAVQLLSSFEGNKIYPEDKTKDEVFDEATKEREINTDGGELPDGKYFFLRKVTGFGDAKGTAIVEDGVFRVLKGATCAPTSGEFVPEIRKSAPIVNNILVDDVICNSPSAAGWIIAGRSNNGWREWKDKTGQPIDAYRKGNN
ncbi:MAG: DUF4357 domain-containing protein [Tissierellia bacterium]|nr:DUF4357 domain-containing protein [Tissierellia bacterium]